MWFEVLVEGSSDVPTLREIFCRRFGLIEDVDFRIHPHRGKGKLPENLFSQPDPRQQTLLHQLPAKLRAFSYLGDDACVVVVVDADDNPCAELLRELNDMLVALPRRPKHVLFRLAIEEIESWFIADYDAVRAAYPRANLQRLRSIAPDSIVGAWETLAEAIGVSRENGMTEKINWAKAISPHLNLADPPSPSLRKLILRISEKLGGN